MIPESEVMSYLVNREPPPMDDFLTEQFRKKKKKEVRPEHDKLLRLYRELEEGGKKEITLLVEVWLSIQIGGASGGGFTSSPTLSSAICAVTSRIAASGVCAVSV